jgi:hypothetical protein
VAALATFDHRLDHRVSIESGLLVKPYAVPEIRSLVENAGFAIEEEFVNGNTYHFIARKPASGLP